ncbi:PIN domain-containing protein [Nitrosomonas sp. wSCUT-2]
MRSLIAPAGNSTRQPLAKRRLNHRRMPTKSKKIYVLDTSVILYNHHAIYSFQNNDVAIPITVLEELDHFKKGNETKNFEAREFIRIMDKLSEGSSLQNWIPIDRPGHGKFKVIMQKPTNGLDAIKIFGENNADHRILNTVIALSKSCSKHKIIGSRLAETIC